MKTIQVIPKLNILDAVQLKQNNIKEVENWIRACTGDRFRAFWSDIDNALGISNSYGDRFYCGYGDYIVRDIDNEFYPIKKDIFHKKYKVKNTSSYYEYDEM